jgi:N-acylneuraminate cytidylyltransferase
LARGGSKGIPNKNIINIYGKPLVAWSIEQSKNSTHINQTYVSSDSNEILKISAEYGAIPLKRPCEFATDTSTSEDALKSALRTIGHVDLVVFLQPTSPIRHPRDIDNAVLELIKNNYDSLFSACKLEDYCIWENKDGFLESINFNYQNRKRRQDKKIQYLENGSIYVFKPSVLFKNNNRLGGKIGISIMEFWKSYEIDSVDDIEICEFYLKKLQNEQ